MGGRAREVSSDLPSKVLYDFIGRIAEKDERRAREVFSFYFDLQKCITIIAAKVRPGGHVCFVTERRRGIFVCFETFL